MPAKDAAADPKPWAADKVERRSVASLVPYAQNSRTHSPEQIAQLTESIKEWGWTVPVLCDEEGGIIAGHGRIMAAQALGIDEVPVMVAVGWTDAQKRAYVIADNKLAANADWDIDVLNAELAALIDEGYDVELSGFDLDEIAELAGAGNEPIELEPLPSANAGEQKAVKLTFGKKTVPLTDGELAQLTASLEAYVNEFGILNGWIGHLLRV